MTTEQRLAAALERAKFFNHEGTKEEVDFVINQSLAAYKAEQKQEATPTARQEALDDLMAWVNGTNVDDVWVLEKHFETIKAALTDQPNVSEDVRESVCVLAGDQVRLWLDKEIYQAPKAVKDALETLIRAAQSPKSEWQDISTAPRDGTVVLLAWPNSTKKFIASNELVPDWKYEVAPYYKHGSGGALSVHGQATHWKPLDAPKKGGG